jgi:hypothetical protein
MIDALLRRRLLRRHHVVIANDVIDFHLQSGAYGLHLASGKNAVCVVDCFSTKNVLHMWVYAAPEKFVG